MSHIARPFRADVCAELQPAETAGLYVDRPD